MKGSILNLWSDLREKRLWPIAVLLAVALVGVPVLLLKSPPEKAAPPMARAAHRPRCRSSVPTAARSRAPRRWARSGPRTRSGR